MSHPTTPKYGELRWTQSLSMLGTLIQLPVVLLWKLATTSFASYNRERSFKRIAAESALRHLVSGLNVPQLQNMFGTTLGTYNAWTTKEKLPPIVDELGEDARLLWIGPKRLDHVVLLFHGGGYVLPSADFLISFWRHVQLELEKQNIEIGIVLLNYSLAPIASFPTPLKQACLALEFLFKAGVKPQNLQFTGDSAGGNLLLQVLSQILHPRDAVPKIELSAPIRGALLVSPWVSLTGESKSHFEYDGIDFVSRDVLKDWGSIVLSGIPEADRAFGEAAKAPEWWFDGVDRLVDRVLITAGGAECLRDDIVVFAEAFKKHHPTVEFIVQKDGLHEDLFLDFFANEKKLVSLTPLVVEWLAAGFASQGST
ncbi:Alpha/Beta hydrolase protein [Mycena rebaudengoi]|nr:Alpha/Beta hydrolase protein [Mycena rebaudengoi]